VVSPYARFVFALWDKGCQDFGSWPTEAGEGACVGIEALYPGSLPRLPHLWAVGVTVAYWLL
jgi:hypothetical protein